MFNAIFKLLKAVGSYLIHQFDDCTTRRTNELLERLIHVQAKSCELRKTTVQIQANSQKIARDHSRPVTAGQIA